MKKISVIVPIYNVEKYLRKCFDSLLEQTFKDFEVLAVNDGSPDNSIEIIKEYANKYPEVIKMIDKPNGGYGSVLQMAIARMETEYFLVCDPDDYLANDALEHLYNLANISNADIVIGAKNYIYNDNTRVDYDSAYNKAYVILKNNYVYKKHNEEFKDLLFIDPSPHSKLYRRTMAESIQFPCKVGYTDNLLFYISLLNAQRVVYTDKACAYYLVDRPGNSMGDISPKAFDANILVFKEIVRQAEGLKPLDMFYYRMFESYKFILLSSRRMVVTKIELHERLNNLYSFIEVLIPHRKAIMNEYKHYTKAKIVEQFKDRMLLDPKFSKKTFDKIANKIVDSYEE